MADIVFFPDYVVGKGRFQGGMGRIVYRGATKFSGGDWIKIS